MHTRAHPASITPGPALALAACLATCLATSACGDLVYQVPVERERDAKLSFPFGDLSGDCNGEEDGVVFESREEDGVTYCSITAGWEGVLFSMVEVRDGIQTELEEEELPVDVDDITVRFTDLRVEGLSVVLERDDEELEMPSFTYYAASGAVEDAESILSVSWSDDHEQGPEHPDVDVLGEGGKDDLLARLNEAYENQEEVKGSGDAELEIVFSPEELERLSGAELSIDFKLITEGAGGVTVNQAINVLGG